MKNHPQDPLESRVTVLAERKRPRAAKIVVQHVRFSHRRISHEFGLADDFWASWLGATGFVVCIVHLAPQPRAAVSAWLFRSKTSPGTPGFR